MAKKTDDSWENYDKGNKIDKQFDILMCIAAGTALLFLVLTLFC